MLERVTPVEFNRVITSGKTKPVALLCEKSDGSTVQVVAKFSAGCEQGIENLIREVIAACLAADLGLPIPRPVLIDIPAEWVALFPISMQPTVRVSSNVAFGSSLVVGGYSAWVPYTRISDILLPTAAAIFVFDAIIQNVDRRSENPNCLMKGDEVIIFDHELAFSHGLMIGWQPPWVMGGLKPMETAGFHIFKSELQKRSIDFTPIRAAWSALSDVRLQEYVSGLPLEWAAAAASASFAIKLIADARDRIDECLLEVQRVLA